MRGEGLADEAQLFRYPPKWIRDQATPEPHRLALRGLANELREVLAMVADTTASEEELGILTGLARGLRKQLSGYPSGRTRAAYGRVAESKTERAFLDTSPLIGLANAVSPPLRLWVEGDRVRGSAVFNHTYEGPPGHVHGGILAAAFDDVLGATQSATGRPGMTARLDVTYLGPTPLNREAQFEGRVVKVEGRKIFASATLQVDGKLCATADGLFVTVDFAEMHNRVLETAAFDKP